MRDSSDGTGEPQRPGQGHVAMMDEQARAVGSALLGLRPRTSLWAAVQINGDCGAAESS